LNWAKEEGKKSKKILPHCGRRREIRRLDKHAYLDGSLILHLFEANIWKKYSKDVLGEKSELEPQSKGKWNGI
jgi:hypothetical protein